MTQQIAMPEEVASDNTRYGDAFVIFSVTVLSCASGTWLVRQMELALWAGMIAALAVYALLLSVHLLARRALTAGAATEAPSPPPAGRAPAAKPFPAGPPLAEPAAPQLPLARAAPPPPPPPAREAARRPEGPAAPAAPAPGELARPRAATPFDFRPAREPSLGPAPAAGTGDPLTKAPEPPSLLDSGRGEISVDFVEESIKKLADALNASPPGPAAPEQGEDTEAMIERSVAALQSAARTMQAHTNPRGGRTSSWWPSGRSGKAAPPPPPPAFGSAPPSATRQPPPVRDLSSLALGTPPPAPPQTNAQLARIAEAVAAERMEVMLEPIHALTEGRPRHFEVSTRLLAADGTALEQQELMRAARGSGLMPRIDAARIVRAARVAARLSQRGRQGAVLAAMAGESLTDAAFLEAAAAPGGANGMTLVLSFAQSEVRAFTPAHTKALAALTPLGFRFALEAVTDLDMDFAALKNMGFAFVELDAPVFLDGLPCAGGRIPASDICRHLADFGLSLIVGRIEDDWLLARVLGFGVLFGKGALFGGPRLVKDEVVSGPAAA
ncbi:MAG TPA: EAL domain-containing protein [Hyphomicrobiaceae bacterium]|nr:EAL domain-containing protein [Hyphomicrobiaceae bacterium]